MNGGLLATPPATPRHASTRAGRYGIVSPLMEFGGVGRDGEFSVPGKDTPHACVVCSPVDR